MSFRLPSFRAALALALLTLLAPALAAAQVGSTTDIITGRVTAVDGSPIEGAQVTVTSLETQVNRAGTTNAKGQYVIVFPDGGGSYRVTVRKLGLAPITLTVQRQSDEDRLVADVRLGQSVTQLSSVEVRAPRQAPGGAQRPEPGNTERALTPEQAARLPIDPNDLNALAALAPGVISIAGTDSTAASFSVAGQRPTQNNLTLDGISFGSASVPQDAVRATRVITNTYDVARGQFTGGQIASTTRSGTNVVQGSGSLQLRVPQLQWRPSVPGAFGQGYSQQQLSFGIGGPLIKDRLFVFASAQMSHRVDPLQSLLAAGPSTLGQLGASADSVQRFLQALETLGIDPRAPGDPSHRLNNNASALTRVDWNLGDAHTLTLRADLRWTGQDASRVGAYSVPNNGGDARSLGGGLMATLTSRFGVSWVHELRAYVARDTRSADPYTTIPQGRVRLSSDLGGTRGITSLAFGANAGLPSSGSGTTFEGTDELSWLSSGGAHRVKLGTLLNVNQSAQQTTVNQFGTYTFNSLGDFLGGTPALFTRSLSPAERSGSAINAAAYLGDTWRQSRALQLTYGVRVEGTTFSGAPAYNAAVDSAFGLRTDRFAGELHVSPRVGFSYTRYPAAEPRGGRDSTGAGGGGGRGRAAAAAGRGGFGAGAPAFFLRGGIGEFRGRTPTTLYAAAQQGTGLAGTESQLVCVGPSVPAADWAAFLAQGTAAIPTACAGPSGNPFATSAPNVTAFARDFAAPRSWRASLGMTRRVLERWTATVDAQYALGVAQYGVRDVNLDATPRFTLAAEGERPVFVAPHAIVPTSGSTTLAASRHDRRFGQVFALGSDLQSRSAQVTASLSGVTTRGMLLNVSYTLARSRDQSSFGAGGAAAGFSAPTTAGDPNGREWARSDLERRHNVVGTMTWPVRPSLELTFVGRLTSGAPYTPMVGGDVNGDGARNDRAFIFDPATAADTAVAAGMRRLLDGAPRRARACLSAQLGHVAARNSCTDPWAPSLDFQINYRPDRWGLARRLALSVVATNSLAGLDQLLHGSDDLHGWGQPQRSDNTLLYVRGFDPAAQRYTYEVNGRFGSTRGLTSAFRAPFQISLQARYSYGMNNQFGGFFGGGGGGGGRGGAGGGGGRMTGGAGGAAGTGSGGASGMLAAASRMANPLAQLLEIRDSLGLDSAQVGRLEALSEALVKKNDALGEEVRTAVQKAGNNPDMLALFAALRPKLNEGRANVDQALKDAQAVLTPEQWAKVPERIRNPFRGVGPGGAGAAGERRPRP